MIRTSTTLSRMLVALLMLFSITAFSQPCLPFGFTFDVTDVSCTGACDGEVAVTLSGATGPCTFDWTPGSPIGDGTSMVTGLCAGTYTVEATDSLGCADFATVTIAVSATPTPSICMVTCNANSTYNIVYWDKTLYNHVDSFLVYREVSTGVYAQIGSVANDSLSEFIDTVQSIGPANGDPNLASYRYKIGIRDICGNYGPLSPYHSTIHIINAGSGDFSWNIPYTIEGEPNPVTNYILLCDTLGVDDWTAVTMVAPTDTVANDPNFAAHASTANWRVKTAWGISCTPTRATVNTTRSNIKNAGISTGIPVMLSGGMLIYPNPADQLLSIELSALAAGGNLRIFNAMGQLVYQAQLSGDGKSVSRIHIDISAWAPGLYSLLAEHQGQIRHQKLVVD